MSTAISLRLEPGQTVTLQPVSWQRFEQILVELGESRSSRIAYFNGTLEIMTPLPEHERSKVLIGDLVKALLKIQKRSWESLGSTTFKREGMTAGIEPDDCFYIENYRAVIGKDRLDLAVDPPPDLAIETDLTSKTELNAYEALRVPELWIYQAGKLTIYLFQQDKYVESQNSLGFPGVAIANLIPQFIQRAKTVGVTQALAEFEQVILEGDR
jgi:Uma2 family endonuclease